MIKEYEMKKNPVWLMAILLLLILTASCSSSTSKAPSSTTPVPAVTTYDVVVDAAFTGTGGDVENQHKTYRTVQAAISAAPADRTQPYVIYIKKGTYKEQVTVNKPYITLYGEDEDGTVITFDKATGSLKPNGTPYGKDCATVTVTAPHFSAIRLTIKNAFDYMGNTVKAESDPTKIQGAQAMAMRTDGDSNHAFISHVKIYGYQDTLLVDRGTHYFDSCTIAGNVDFIYGSGQAVFNHCEIISRGSGGYITAASTLSDHYGFLIINSKLEKESPKMADGSVSLGRPWHNNPNVVYINTFMDSHISSAGWTSMGSLTPNDARYFEYGSTGPGAIKSNTRKMLTDDQVHEYTIASFLGGWNPDQPAKNAKISVYIAGEDTASGAKSASGIGWGKALPSLFDNRVTVHNEAIPGSSSKSYMDQNGLNKLAGELKKNDVLLIQFGQNDGNKNDPKTYADWMINYKTNLKRFISTAQKRGAVPVLITPVKFDANGKLAALHNDYTNSMVELAKIIGVSYIDLSSDTGPVSTDEMAKRIAHGIQKDQLQLSYFVKEESGHSP